MAIPIDGFYSIPLERYAGGWTKLIEPIPNVWDFNRNTPEQWSREIADRWLESGAMRREVNSTDVQRCKELGHIMRGGWFGPPFHAPNVTTVDQYDVRIEMAGSIVGGWNE